MGLCKIEIEQQKKQSHGYTKIHVVRLLAYVHKWHRGESFTNKRKDYKGSTKHSHKTQTPNTPKRALNQRKHVTRENLNFSLKTKHGLEL